MSVDNVPPDVFDPVPSDGGFTSSRKPEISVRIRDELSGMDNSSISLEIDNRTPKVREIAGGRVTCYPRSPLEEGPHVARVEAENLEGNSEELAWTFEVDATRPGLVVTNPADNSSTRDEKIEVRGTVDEPLRSLRINGREIPLENGRFREKVDLDEGRNSISVTAVDEAGNIAQESLSVERKKSLQLLFSLVLGSGFCVGLAAGALISSRGKEYWKEKYERASKFFAEKVFDESQS